MLKNIMQFRQISALFFFFYGILIPFLSYEFFEKYMIASIAMVGISWLIAFMLLSGRAVLFSILIAVYIFKTYLVRPYIDIFLPYVTLGQYEYILGNNYFFKASYFF